MATRLRSSSGNINQAAIGILGLVGCNFHLVYCNHLKETSSSSSEPDGEEIVSLSTFLIH